MSLSKEEFIVQNKLAEDCIILEPWEDFSPAIETVLSGKRIVYDFNKLVESLAESYRRDAKTPENPDYDYERLLSGLITVLCEVYLTGRKNFVLLLFAFRKRN